MMAITTSSSTKVKPRNLRLMFNALEKMIKKTKAQTTREACRKEDG